MKQYFTFFLLISLVTKTDAQQKLFLGFYSKNESGKGPYCRDIEMVKELVSPDTKYVQLEKDFQLAHPNQNAYIKLYSKHVVIYEFQKKVLGFGCTIKVMGSLEGDSPDNLQQLLNKERERIAKEYKAQISEVFAWAGKGSIAKPNEVTTQLGGVNITLRPIKSGGEIGNSIALLKNSRTDSAAHIVFVIDGVQQKESYTLQPGQTTQVNLGNLKTLEILLKPVKKGEEPQTPDAYNKLKNYLRQNFTKENGGYKTNGTSIGPRG